MNERASEHRSVLGMVYRPRPGADAWFLACRVIGTLCTSVVFFSRMSKSPMWVAWLRGRIGKMLNVKIHLLASRTF